MATRSRARRSVPGPPEGLYPGAGALPRGVSAPWFGDPRGGTVQAQHTDCGCQSEDGLRREKAGGIAPRRRLRHFGERCDAVSSSLLGLAEERSESYLGKADESRTNEAEEMYIDEAEVATSLVSSCAFSVCCKLSMWLIASAVGLSSTCPVVGASCLLSCIVASVAETVMPEDYVSSGFFPFRFDLF